MNLDNFLKNRSQYGDKRMGENGISTLITIVTILWLLLDAFKINKEEFANDSKEWNALKNIFGDE